jgi:hypothetical protein
VPGKLSQVMERECQPLRPQDVVRDALRASMEAHGLTAKELSREIREQTGQVLDYRTIQNAAGPGSCSLETYFVLCGFFGWDFTDQTMTPAIGASRIASLEREIAHEKAVIRSREAQLARLRSAAVARGAATGGTLRLVGEEDRLWSA